MSKSKRADELKLGDKVESDTGAALTVTIAPIPRFNIFGGEPCIYVEHTGVPNWSILRRSTRVVLAATEG